MSQTLTEAERHQVAEAMRQGKLVVYSTVARIVQARTAAELRELADYTETTAADALNRNLLNGAEWAAAVMRNRAFRLVGGGS